MGGTNPGKNIPVCAVLVAQLQSESTLRVVLSNRALLYTLGKVSSVLRRSRGGQTVSYNILAYQVCDKVTTPFKKMQNKVKKRGET